MNPSEMIKTILKSDDDTAKEKFKEYLSKNEYNQSNFKYFLGYYDAETTKKIYEKVGELLK